jgi:hypothetical protein
MMPVVPAINPGSAAEPMISETFFIAEEKHAIRVQKFRDNKNFQDLRGDRGIAAAVELPDGQERTRGAGVTG